MHPLASSLQPLASIRPVNRIVTEEATERLSDYCYELPPELIANRPSLHREGARMLVLHRKSGQIEHRLFKDLPDYLTPHDLLVLNDSKVIPARLYDSSGRIEVLLIQQRDDTHWVAMVKPGRKMRVGSVIFLGDAEVTVLEIFSDGTRLLEFNHPIDLERWGTMPIPPYFKRPADAIDRERYQTVFARDPGSVAAPTAGLHFTQEILEKLPHVFLTLHVGPGTFLPVKSDNVSEHQMHHERYEIKEGSAEQINKVEAQQGRIIAVGTTTTRVLESQPPGKLSAVLGSTDIFIRPPYQFQKVDALLTNFHLPASTLLMLVSAMAGREKILAAYEEAVREQYRFFSYGDCMLIL